MKIKNDQQHYGLIAIAFHWLIAIGTFALFGLGLWMVELGYYDTWYHKAPEIHGGAGMLLFILLLMRIVWKQCNIRPESLDNHKQWQKISANVAHHSLNGLLLVITISGYLIVTAKGDALNVFNLFSVPATLSGFVNQADFAGDCHLVAAWFLMVLAIIHALASLKHHFIDKNNTLKRMLNL